MDAGNTKRFLGTGFRFPIQVDKATGRMKTSSYEEDIQEAIQIILRTKKGERIRNPLFGCGIHDFTFGTTDYGTLKQMERNIEEALLTWEPRIKNIEVHASLDKDTDGKVLFEIKYNVATTNNPVNMVFPFYIEEGYGPQ